MQSEKFQQNPNINEVVIQIFTTHIVGEMMSQQQVGTQGLETSPEGENRGGFRPGAPASQPPGQANPNLKDLMPNLMQGGMETPMAGSSPGRRMG